MILKNSFLVLAIPPPRPPKVKAGLIIAGSPICFRDLFDCLKFVRSNNFYTKNPKLYMEIYEGIDKKIKFIKDSLNNVKK